MDETSGAIFARRMRQERVVAGLTQADVAQRLVDLGVAIDASAITRIERHNRVVKLDEAVAIAEVIGLFTNEGVVG